GVDQALWDIKGKRAGMPVYQLLGGKVRQAAPLYAHASGRDFAEVEERARAYIEQGYGYVRCQVAVPGQSTYGSPASRAAAGNQPPHLRQDQEPWEPGPYCRLVPRLFEHMRSRLGEDIELLHDVHERIPPIMAVQLARDLEPY